MSSGQAVRSKRGRETALDMVRSLGLMVVVIGLLIVITPARKLIFPGPSGSAGTAITDTQQLAEWQQLTGRPAQLPAVPSGWRINAATMSGTRSGSAHLHVGWVTPQSQYVGVDQGYIAPRKLLAAAVGASKPAGTVTIAGKVWTARTDRHGDPAYLLRQGRYAVVVTGSVGAVEVRRLVAELRPVGST